MADVVFMALHGENGENGKVQAAFDLFGIKYEYKQHQYKECVEQDINKKLKAISFYGADAKAARINLRIATEFSCPACGRPVAKRQSQPLYYCLYCDMTYDKKQLKKGVAND